MPSWLQEIDHTADSGIEVTASSEKELFERAATGMFSLLTRMEDVRDVAEVDVAVDADDREALLVRWLSQLNYLHQVDSMVFCRFEIETLGVEHLEAAVYGEKIDPNRHTIYCEIKAVTFHELDVRRDGNEWSVQIIFDM